MPWFHSFQAPGDVSKITPSNNEVLVYNSTTLRWELADKGTFGATDWIYLGDPTTNGTWRVGRNGNDLEFQRRESGNWISKGAMTP